MKIGDLVKGTWEDSLIGILIQTGERKAGMGYFGKVYWSNGACYRYPLNSLEAVK